MANDLLNQGRHALSTGQWEQSKTILEEALIRNPSAEVYEELAWANWWLNNIPVVFELRSKAFNLFLRNNNMKGASRTACWLALDHIELKGEFAVGAGWIKRAESFNNEIPDTWELCLFKLIKARWVFQVEKNSKLAFHLIEEALKISKSLNNIDGEMLAEALKGFILIVEGKISEGMPLLDEATLIALTSEHSDIKITTITCCYLIDACEKIRDIERASQWCNNVKEICKRWRYKAMFANCRMKYAGVLIWKGEWREAEQELLSASTELKELRPVQVRACTIRLADLKRRQGKWIDAEKLLSEVEAYPPAQLFSAYLCFDKGEFEKAQNFAERFLRRFSIEEKAERTVAIELLIRIYVKLGKFEQAQEMLNELGDTASAINTQPLKGAFLSARGYYFNAIENLEQARQNLEDAVDIYNGLPSPFESAQNRLILSEVLIKMELFIQAETELKAASAIFKELGAEKDFEKCRYYLKNLYKDKVEELDKTKYEFTGRELEVIKLIAEGKNNEEIAGQLFLSIRTIEKHITNIYQKLGVSGKSARAFASSYAIKNKLI